jgi:hypothetical protein
MPARHDINANQGETLNLHLLYTDSNDNVIDLSSYSADMQVRRTFYSDDRLLHLTGTSNGFGGATAGITGATGGIYLNRNAGNTGSETGGVLIVAGATGTSLIPGGKHLYDLEINSNGTITRLIEGRFECPNEVTR